MNMRIFLIIFILILSFQSLCKADDIRDFEIVGISVGDSLNDHFNNNEIQKALKSPTYYPKSKKYKVLLFNSKNRDLFDYFNITIKSNNDNFIIEGLRGEKEMAIDECNQNKLQHVKGAESILQKAEKRDYESAYGNNYGNSKAYVTEFFLPDESIVRIYCADFDETNILVKDNLWHDSLEVGFASKEFASFLLNEAY